ncbi:hypothetical protein [Flammeovirga sp. SJP92]|uniref:hypothetical protein n=1 Tax=Flammeovirga sp. SJP92 TaxID=1775430 RepID=UPI000786B03E|nr:hypothetical protein [Flammeovirga sp. SJP92]KXX70849.1 hypothetical protein AVL50_11450 [Flammeovirga sp. SJP92]
MMDAKKKDFIKFTIVMLVFMAGMIVLIVNHIDDWYIWLIYIAIWTYAEMIIVKDLHFKWWVWVLIIGGLSIIDWIVITHFG